MNIIPDERFQVKQGTVYTVNLRENRLPNYIGELTKKLLGQVVHIEGSPHKIMGIEASEVPEYMKISTVGLLVKPIGNV